MVYQIKLSIISLVWSFFAGEKAVRISRLRKKLVELAEISKLNTPEEEKK
jgi:hypothetical protein